MDDIFNELKKEVVILHAIWKLYRGVYAQDDEANQLINDTGQAFFYTVEVIMLEKIALYFSKLLDPSKKGSNKNLTLSSLIDISKKRNDLDIHEELIDSRDLLDSKCQKFKALRNKRIAHQDYDFTFQQRPSGFSRKYVEAALAQLRDFMHLFEAHYYKSTELYSEVLINVGDDGYALIEALKDAKSYRENNSSDFDVMI